MKKYSELTNNVLLCLATAGVIAVAATSPFTLLGIAQSILRNNKLLAKEIEAWKVSRILQKLKRNRVIILKETEKGDLVVELTEQGKRKVKEIQLENLAIEKPTSWDRKWRVVIFDIPEEKWRSGRDALRDKLQKLGFVFTQKSVWVLPWPCENEILFLCELYDIHAFVNILTVEKIYNDVKLRKHFHLL